MTRLSLFLFFYFYQSITQQHTLPINPEESNTFIKLRVTRFLDWTTRVQQQNLIPVLIGVGEKYAGSRCSSEIYSIQLCIYNHFPSAGNENIQEVARELPGPRKTSQPSKKLRILHREQLLFSTLLITYGF